MDLKVHINNVHGSQMAAKITGTFEIERNTFRFNAIAFGRIGGQNIGAKLSKVTQTELEKLGYDAEEVVMLLQKCLLEGDLDLPAGLKKETFAD